MTNEGKDMIMKTDKLSIAYQKQNGLYIYGAKLLAKALT